MTLKILTILELIDLLLSIGSGKVTGQQPSQGLALYLVFNISTMILKQNLCILTYKRTHLDR